MARELSSYVKQRALADDQKRFGSSLVRWELKLVNAGATHRCGLINDNQQLIVAQILDAKSLPAMWLGGTTPRVTSETFVDTVVPPGFFDVVVWAVDPAMDAKTLIATLKRYASAVSGKIILFPKNALFRHVRKALKSENEEYVQESALAALNDLLPEFSIELCDNGCLKFVPALGDNPSWPRLKNPAPPTKTPMVLSTPSISVAMDSTPAEVAPKTEPVETALAGSSGDAVIVALLLTPTHCLSKLLFRNEAALSKLLANSPFGDTTRQRFRAFVESLGATVTKRAGDTLRNLVRKLESPPTTISIEESIADSIDDFVTGNCTKTSTTENKETILKLCITSSPKMCDPFTFYQKQTIVPNGSGYRMRTTKIVDSSCIVMNTIRTGPSAIQIPGFVKCVGNNDTKSTKTAVADKHFELDLIVTYNGDVYFKHDSMWFVCEPTGAAVARRVAYSKVDSDASVYSEILVWSPM